ncbi:Gfo/Idh/MocA family protein [Microbacterium cremeum]|uniref:Gfo/Idh/MocA family protein n=1 Tax=Microbacterium cremeum TaxID=2782169 RepID=UPI0018876C43|nr:Gfo/Idh/MocA family oxidoreductase [Microbacterium cremeum]
MGGDLRVGVVGAGIMGADHIARIAKRTSGAVVSAVVDSDQGRATAAAAQAPGTAVFARVEDAIESGAVDAVLIAVPGQFHEPVLVPALEARLPVLCEKPLTPDSTSAMRVLELEQKLDRPHIQVGFMRRFDAEYSALRDLVASQDAGALLMVRGVHRNPSVPESYMQSMMITDSVVHEIDVVPWIAGSTIKTIEVKYPRRNSLAPERLREPILVIMELENGVLVDVELSASAQFGYQVATEAVFERGIARIGQPAGLQQWRAGSFTVRDHDSYTTRFAAAYDTQVQRWVDAVRNGSLVDGPNAWDGYVVALACEAGVRALDGGVIPVEAAIRPDFYA